MNGHSVPFEVSAITAAAQVLSGTAAAARPVYYDTWQQEAWGYYENLGEFNYGVEWFGEALSRIRLNVAKVSPGGDEPEPVTSGPAADLIESLAGGTDGQSQLLRSFGVQLSVPGDCYLVGREVTDEDLYLGTTLDAMPDDNNRVWTVQPTQTLQPGSRGVVRDAMSRIFGGRGPDAGRNERGWRMQVDEALWIDLPHESLVTRVWDRNERLPWRASSPARAALPIMREIDMYNRHIMATLISRVALNGLLLIPEEVTLPANPNYEDAADPFVAELIDIMKNAIQNPGTAVAAAPLPLRVPAEMIEKFRHFTFATPMDEKIWQARDGAIRRLATTLNLPQEVLTGMGDVNHWSAWQLTEDAIKIHIAPKVEIVTRCLTLGFLWPMLRGSNQQLKTKKGERLIVWYDTSELTQRPDKSDVAVQLRGLHAITDTALRRETGFDEADTPSDDELERQILTDLAVQPPTAAQALKELFGTEMAPPPGPPTPVAGETPAPNSGPGGAGNAPKGETSPATGAPPRTRGKSPPAPNGQTSAALRQAITLSRIRLEQQRAGPVAAAAEVLEPAAAGAPGR